MTDDAGETPTTEEPKGSDTQADSATHVDWEQEAAKWKALSRKNEDAAKKHAAAIAEAEEATKTEAQKLTEKVAQAEGRATTAELRIVRLEVAASKGLSLSMANRLQGETKEELEADADELLTHLQPKPGDTPSGRPRETLRSGTAPDTRSEENDPAKLAAMVPRG